MNISVLITTYNKAALLERCLLGYLRQTERNYELVISDDGSTDATRNVVENFAKRTTFPITS